MCSALPWSNRKLYFGFLRSRSLITYGGTAWVRPPRGHAPARAGVEEAFSAGRAAGVACSNCGPSSTTKSASRSMSARYGSGGGASVTWTTPWPSFWPIGTIGPACAGGPLGPGGGNPAPPPVMAAALCAARCWIDASVSAGAGLATAWRERRADEGKSGLGAGWARATQDHHLAPADAHGVAVNLLLVERVLCIASVSALDESDEAAVARARLLLIRARPHDL